MGTTFIYVLNDPRTGRTRYVGKSDSPFQRYDQHLKGSEQRDTHKNRWIRSLQKEGLVPTMELLDEVPTQQWEFWEREYIRVFRALGTDLVNTTDGGEGVAPGTKFSLETRAKMSAIRRGKILSPETRAKLSVIRRGRKFSPSHCANISTGHKGQIPWNKGKRKTI